MKRGEYTRSGFESGNPSQTGNADPADWKPNLVPGAGFEPSESMISQPFSPVAI
jgi:hypothetical protein